MLQTIFGYYYRFNIYVVSENSTIWGFFEKLCERYKHIDVLYIDALIDSSILYPQSIKQLEKIKELFVLYPTTKLNKDRMRIENGFVVVDGFGLPIKITEQSFDNMTKNDNPYLYQSTLMGLLNFISDFVGEFFDRSILENQSFINRELGHTDICKMLNANNHTIVESLYMIINIDGYVPIIISKGKKVIFLILQLDDIRSGLGRGRISKVNCLAPSLKKKK